MKFHTLLNGEVLDLASLGPEDSEFLGGLEHAARGGADYFELLRRVKGPGAYPLLGGRLTPSIARSLLYRVGHDIADRVGIDQGYVLAPGVEPGDTPTGPGLLSLTEASELIGISRAAAHQAISEGRLSATRVGNAWILRREDAVAYKEARSGGAPSGRAAAHAR